MLVQIAPLEASASSFPKFSATIEGTSRVGESLQASVKIKTTKKYSASFIWWSCKRETKSSGAIFIPANKGCKQVARTENYEVRANHVGLHVLLQATLKIGNIRKIHYSKSVKVLELQPKKPELVWTGSKSLNGQYGQIVTISRPKSWSGSKVELVAGSPEICTIMNEGKSGTSTFELRLNQSGVCKLQGYSEPVIGWHSGHSEFSLNLFLTKREQTIDFFAPLELVFSTQKNLLIVGPTSNLGLNVDVESLTEDVCIADWSGTFYVSVKWITDGNCQIRASQDGDSQSVTAEPMTISFPVVFDIANSKLYPTLTFSGIDTSVLEGDSFILEYPSTNSNGLITLESDSPSICTIQIVSITSVRLTTLRGGTCVIRAHVAESEIYFGKTDYLQFSINSKVRSGTLLAAVPIGLKSYCSFIIADKEYYKFLDYSPDWTTFYWDNKNYVRYNSIWGTMLFNYQKSGNGSWSWTISPANNKAYEAFTNWGCPNSFNVWG